VIRMFLTPKYTGPRGTGQREKSDHPTLEEAQRAYAQHPNRGELEALIYIDGAPAWVGGLDASGRVHWQPWHV
jgi:hypothetical protein